MINFKVDPLLQWVEQYGYMVPQAFGIMADELNKAADEVESSEPITAKVFRESAASWTKRAEEWENITE